LAQIFQKYGEERNNRLLASAIVDTKYALGRIQTTEDLSRVISSHAYREYLTEREYASAQVKQTENALMALRSVDPEMWQGRSQGYMILLYFFVRCDRDRNGL
jgi:hypothetical protein